MPVARRFASTSAAVAVAVLVGLGVPASAPPAAALSAASAPASSRALVGRVADQLADWQKGQWWVDAVRLKERHAAGITGKGVTIALLNGPVNTSIPELKGQDVRPTASICGANDAQWGPLTPTQPLNDTSFHTTSMAAVLVGSGKGNGPNGTGVLGVAPGATLRTYALFNTLDPQAHQNLMCDLSQMVPLIDRVVADGADIIEIPQTVAAGSAAFQAAIDRAIAKGVIVVCGAGNDGPSSLPIKPADTQGILVVGAIDENGAATAESPTSLSPDFTAAQRPNAVLNIHLMAPGQDIVAGSVSDGQWTSDALQDGTSGASAIVAGQLALMKQRWPKATSNQLLYSLLRSARRVAGAPLWAPRTGFGATSFEATLTTDPSGYPDVQPFYDMSNVFSDHPVPPFMPTAVGGNPSTAGVPGAGAAGARDGGSTPSLALVLGIVVLVLIAVAGGLFVLRSRRAAAAVGPGPSGGGAALDRGRPGPVRSRAQHPDDSDSDRSDE